MRQVDDATAIFETHRARLLRIAYRMLGSRSEAEDVVQNAWLRWIAADRTGVAAPYPFLARVVSIHNCRHFMTEDNRFYSCAPADGDDLL